MLVKGGGGGLVAKSCLFVTPWTVACQAPRSMALPRQEYGGRLPFPSLGELLQTRELNLLNRWVLYHRVTGKPRLRAQVYNLRP